MRHKTHLALKFVSVALFLCSIFYLTFVLVLTAPSDHYRDTGWGVVGNVAYNSYCTTVIGDIGLSYSEIRCYGKFKPFEQGIRTALIPADFLTLAAIVYPLLFYSFFLYGFYIILRKFGVKLAEQMFASTRSETQITIAAVIVLLVLITVVYGINFASDSLMRLDSEPNTGLLVPTSQTN